MYANLVIIVRLTYVRWYGLCVSLNIGCCAGSFVIKVDVQYWQFWWHEIRGY